MDLGKVETILQDRENRPEGLIEVLQDMQAQFGYLPEDALRRTSECLAVPLIEVFRVANFYKAFALEPRGRHLLTVCLGTACHVRGAPRFVDEVERLLGVAPGKTTKNGAFTFETVNCLGCCALGPIALLDGIYYEHMSTGKLRKLLQKTLKQDREVVLK